MRCTGCKGEHAHCPMRLRSIIVALTLCVLIASGEEKSSVTPIPVTDVAVDSATALESLGRAIRSELAGRGIRNAMCGVKVVDLKTNRDIFSIHASEPLTPASTMKLFTSSTALGIFGSTFKVATDILADTLKNGVVYGNLYVKGHGDPMLTANDFDSLVEVMKHLGITRVTGDVIGDANFFDNVVDRAKYSGDGEMVENIPPVSALTINRNSVIVVAHAGARGERVRVQTVPHVPSISISSTATSVAPRAARRAPKHGKKRRHASIESPSVFQFASVRHRHRHARPVVKRGTRAGGLRFSIGRSASGKQSIVVSGAMVVGGTTSRVVELVNPALAAASMLKFRLESNGIHIDGDAVTGATPAEAVLVCAHETPLVDICALMNKHSDNFAAEQLFKMIGASYCPLPSKSMNTADSSVKYINVYLASCKINTANCEFHDGSGLSHHAAVTPNVKVALLKSIYSRDTLFRAFYSTLAIGGVDGTIRGRMRGTVAENNVHAKTGTLNSVTALAGYVTTRDGDLWAFDITMNHARVYLGRNVQDRIVEKLAGFTYKK